MNRQFMKTFEVCKGIKEFELFKKEKQFTPVDVTEEHKAYIRKYLLKSEGIEAAGSNEIIVGTNNSEYRIAFYKEGIVFIAIMNGRTMLKNKNITRYFREA